MGCGSKANEKVVIVKLLNSEISDFTIYKENEISCWSNVYNISNSNHSTLKPANQNTKNKSKANGSRLLYWNKLNNKMNNFNFQFYDSVANYIVQYRNENKFIKCLSNNMDLGNNNVIFSESQKEISSPLSSYIYGIKQDSSDKSLNYQVRYWRNQNQELDKYRPTTIDVNDFSKHTVSSQGSGLHLTPNNSGNCGYRSSFNNKRNPDVNVPQGSGYDILSDDNRISRNIEIDKLTVDVKKRTHSLDGLGLMNYPQQNIRETIRVKNCIKDGGTIEFTKLLDEKLRILYERKNLYQPSFEFNRSKPDIKPKKAVPRQRSANCQIPNDHVNGLSINGRSTRATGKSSAMTIPSTVEDQFRIDITGRCYFQ